MIEKVKSGKIEIIKPDKDAAKTLKKILRQNEKILAMNAQIVATLMKPVTPIIIDKEE